MPTETSRVIKRKRVNLPDGSTVDIPVITQITFLDVVEQGQEYEFHVENSAAANRDVHVAAIPGGGGSTDESGGGSNGDGSNLKVERVDVWRVLDIVERAQESFIHFDNKTVQEPPDAPPYFTTHEKSHLVKYINTPDDGNWIKSELIDRFKVLDVVEQGQEKEYFLFNPPDNTGISGLTLDTDADGNPTVAVDPSLPDISDSSNGIDPPWRADPFQNIVDFSSNPPHFGISFFSIEQGTGRPNSVLQVWLVNGPGETDTGVSIDDPAPDGTFPLGKNLAISYATKVPIIFESSGSVKAPNETGGQHVEFGVPPMTGSPAGGFTFGAWEWGEGTNVGSLPPQPPPISGPPLVVNGKTIPGFLATLTVTYNFFLGKVENAQIYDFANLGPYGTTGFAHHTWIAAFVGVLQPQGTVGGPDVPFLVGQIKMVVSGAPFTFNGGTYQAVGLPESLNSTLSNASEVYCIRLS